MSKPIIYINWLDDSLRQIEIIVKGNGNDISSRLVYPRPKGYDIEQYRNELKGTLSHIQDLFKNCYVGRGVYSPYGIMGDKTAIIPTLLRWQRHSGEIYNDKIDVIVAPMPNKDFLSGEIKRMAADWGLSNCKNESEVCREADIFSRYIMGNYLWMFDFKELDENEKCLLNINKDALELTWYKFNKDIDMFNKKYSELVDDKKVIWGASINAHVREFDDFKTNELKEKE